MLYAACVVHSSKLAVVRYYELFLRRASPNDVGDLPFFVSDGLQMLK